MNISLYGIYTAVYIGLCNWIQLYYLLGNLLKPMSTLIEVDGKGLKPLIKKKTGLDLTILQMAEKRKMIGFMIANPPFKPTMIFSQKLYESLNRDEFEWVALHESAHYLMWHNLKFALVQLSLYFLGIFLIYFFGNFFVLSGFVLGYAYIQAVRRFEFQADNFAAIHMDHPEGMISGNIKMKKANQLLMGGNSFLQRLIIAVSPEDRIRMAEKEIERRSVKTKHALFTSLPSIENLKDKGIISDGSISHYEYF